MPWFACTDEELEELEDGGYTESEESEEDDDYPFLYIDMEGDEIHPCVIAVDEGDD